MHTNANGSHDNTNGVKLEFDLQLFADEPAAETTAEPAAEPSTILGSEPEPAKEQEQPNEEKPKEEPEKPVVPENYEFKLPEGVKPDDPFIGEFSTIGKEIGLPQDSAQKLIDWAIKKGQEQNAASLSSYQQQMDSWATETKAIPTFKEDMSYAAKAIDYAGGSALRKVLDDTGLGNNPDIFKSFAKLGKAMSEDTFTEGKQKSSEVSAAEILYPSMKK